MAEDELWPKGEGNRRTPWKDVVSRSKTNSGWPWMPGSGGMDTLRNEALKQGRWRLGEDGYIEKGPFPKEKTSVNVLLQATNPETGESILALTPRNAGESPVVHYSTKPEVLETDLQVEELENFSTSEGTLYFLVRDTTGTYESGPPTCWTAELKVRHQVESIADKRVLTLQCTPPAEMLYTLDGSNPKDGSTYEEPFEIEPESQLLLVYAQSGEANETARFQIPQAGDQTIQIDDTKPAKLTGDKRVLLDSTDRVFAVINRFREREATKFKGVIIEIGEGEHTVTVRFQEREITAAVIEGTITSLRELLNEDQAQISVNVRSGVSFVNGFEAKEFAELAGIELRPGDVVQED